MEVAAQTKPWDIRSRLIAVIVPKIIVQSIAADKLGIITKIGSREATVLGRNVRRERGEKGDGEELLFHGRES